MSGDAPVEIRFTAKEDSLYAICLGWPETEILVRTLGKRVLPDRTIARVRMLGSNEPILWQQGADGLKLSLPDKKPCRHAFVYRIDFNHES